MRPSWRPGENLDPQAPLQTSKLCFSKEGVAVLHLFALDRYHHHMIQKQTRNKRDALRSPTPPVPIHPSLLLSSKRNRSFIGLLCVLPVMFLYANRGTQTHFLLPLTKRQLAMCVTGLAQYIRVPSPSSLVSLLLSYSCTVLRGQY